MTGTTPTMNPMTGLNAYANGGYNQQPFQGFWGSGFGGNTPFGFGTQAYQPGVTNPISNFSQQYTQPFTPQFTPQSIQQPGISGQQFGGFGQQTGQWQTGIPQMALQSVLNTVLQTTPPQIVNTILQTTPPQVLPYVLDALACQQTCQQVLAQNPQVVQGINPQAIVHPLLSSFQGQGQMGFGGIGAGRTPFGGGFQAQGLPQYLQQACVGCAPGQQQWQPNAGFQGQQGGFQGQQGGFGQFTPQQPWLNTTYGTW